MTLLFSNGSNQRKPFFTPVPAELSAEAVEIASIDGDLFDKSAQFTPENYQVSQDQTILAALNYEQNKRIQKAQAENIKPRPQPK